MKTGADKKLKNDIIFISVLLLVFFLVGAYLFLFRGEGDTVTVKVALKVYGEYPLHEDRVVEIEGNGTLNILVIQDGKAYMQDASCPDGICTDHYAIFRDGESIICKPNQVVVTVTAKNEESPDIVA
jgi:hypothetical protein